MKLSPEKARRLERVARLYYEEDRTQEEIARGLGVSRPLISRLLREARAAGLVEIRVHSWEQREHPLMSQAREAFGLKGGALVTDEAENHLTNQALALAAIEDLRALGGGRIGLGWGHIIGTLVQILERRPPERDLITEVCPMVGNSHISIRNYHSNENVRIVAHHTLATPHFLHTPAFAETREEMDLLRKTENYKTVLRQWEKLDVALVNIGNYPSTPDFASRARFGNLLAQRRAVGRLIAYYFDVSGEIIHSDFDYALQIPLELLARSRHVVGLCSANLGWRALAGALRTGFLTHVVAREELLREVLAHPEGNAVTNVT